MVKLNPQKDSCHCSRIGIIKLFINLLKARVVTKPSSRNVAFIPYIDLAPRSNPHSFHIHKHSQFAWHSPTHWPHLPGQLCYISKSASQPQSMVGLLPKHRISLQNQCLNVTCSFKKIYFILNFLFKKISSDFFHLYIVTSFQYNKQYLRDLSQFINKHINMPKNILIILSTEINNSLSSTDLNLLLQYLRLKYLSVILTYCTL